jgi:anti-sigma factor RsiW
VKPANRDVVDLDLMMHVDGELEDSEQRAVEAQLNAPDVRVKVAAIRELGELVRGHIELATDEAEPRLAAMWTELAKRFDNETAPASPAEERPPATGGVRKAAARWFERYRGHLLTATVSAGAVAALALVMRPTLSGPKPGTTVFGGTGRLPPTFVSTPPEIESLDVPNGSGTVLTIEDEDGATAIVWVTPDDAEGI